MGAGRLFWINLTIALENYFRALLFNFGPYDYIHSNYLQGKSLVALHHVQSR